MNPSSPAPRRPRTSPLPPLLPLFASLGLLALSACGGSTSSITGGDGGTDGGGTTEGGATEGGGGGEGGGGVSAAQAATDAAHAYCTRAQTCAPFYVGAAFGDVATCETRLQAQLVSELGAPGVVGTPATFETCAAALPQASCSDLLGRVTLPQCPSMAGTVAAGAGCATDGQCVGKRCHVPAGATCGTCGTPAAAGASCASDSDCDSAMKCLGGLCAPYGAAGATCSATQPCRPDLGCVGGTCGTPSPLGTACKSSDECDQLHGDFCNPMSLVCQAVTLAPAGSPCGLVASQLVLCAGPGSFCKGDNVAPYQGTCVAYAKDGSSCDGDAGPLCDYGAVCVAGTCQVPDPAACK